MSVSDTVKPCSNNVKGTTDVQLWKVQDAVTVRLMKGRGEPALGSGSRLPLALYSTLVSRKYILPRDFTALIGGV